MGENGGVPVIRGFSERLVKNFSGIMGTIKYHFKQNVEPIPFRQLWKFGIEEGKVKHNALKRQPSTKHSVTMNNDK